MRYVSLRALGLGLVLQIVLAVVTVGADTNPLGWVSGGTPTLVKQLDLLPTDSLPTTVAGLGNRDCSNMTVVTRPARLFQPQITSSACFVTTRFGAAESNGLIRFDGSRLAGESINFDGYAPGLIAIPNSLDFINYASAGFNGLFLHFTRSIPSPLSVVVASSGEVKYKFIQDATSSLRDKSGALLPAQTDSLAFSSNGEWMVVDSPGRAMLRVNVATLEVLPFAPAFIYSLGFTPGAQTAISNDGRYVVVASKPNSVFKIYDLATCSALPVPYVITTSLPCQSRDLWPFMQNQVNGFLGTFNIRFSSDTIITFYGLHPSGGTNIRTKFTLLAPGETQENVAYIGMGDSFASGEGDNLGIVYYEDGTDEELNRCHLSKRSYPYLLTSILGVSSFHSVACSGAVIRNVTGRANGDIQYPKTPSSYPLGQWIPARDLQYKYLAVARPDFLTISIGGNDVGFGDILAECTTSHFKVPLPTTCKYAGDPTERANFAKLLANQYSKLRDVYSALAMATDKRTKIYVVGYPQFIKGQGGSCGINVRLNDEERQFVAKGTAYMNQVIKAAADASGVYYLDTEQALQDHNLCSLVDDTQMAVNGLSEGDDKRIPWWAAYIADSTTRIGVFSSLGIGNESFHPNANGHRLLSDKILQLTGGDPGSYVVCPNNLGVICPQNNQIPVPDADYFGPEAADYVRNLNVPNSVYVAPPTPQNMIVQDSSLHGLQTRIDVPLLMPGSVATVKILSSPVELGRFSIGNNAELNIVLTIPDTLEAGIHRLQVNGTNLAGEAVTYYQTVFVAGPDGDINANGVNDSQESCGFVPVSAQDRDLDGVDDGCDGFIGPESPSKTASIVVRQMSAR